MPNNEGFTLCTYPEIGLPPERQELSDLVKAEKAFNDAKFAAVLWQCRPPGEGLGWIKLKEKETPPPAPPGVAKPAATAPTAKSTTPETAASATEPGK